MYLPVGLFEPSHMHYEADRVNTNINPHGEPSIAEMTKKAIQILSRGKHGFFLLVEGIHLLTTIILYEEQAVLPCLLVPS